MKEFPKKEVFKLLQVDKSSYYRRQKERLEKGEDALALSVCQVFWRHSRRYGSRRIHAELRAEGWQIGRGRIRKVMNAAGLKAIQPSSFVPRTTNSCHSLGYSPNLLLAMKLPPDRPLVVIVGDITYLPLADGSWAYLATWTDLFSRRILGLGGDERDD